MNKERLLDSWESLGLTKRLIDAFLSVPRESFIEPSYLDEAYGDYPLPIGHGQTISQPTTVMLMLSFLDLQKGHNALEIGAGCGYNAAIMSRLCRHVTSVEIVPELAEMSRRNLKNLDISNVSTITGDGSLGHPDNAPYDRIVVTAACPEIPPPLIEQLAEGGKIVAPVGEHGQTMIVGTKRDGRMEFEDRGAFVFVPLLGEFGFT